MKPLLVVDGDNLAHRAYHSTPKTVLGPDGSPINAFVGFFSMLSRVWAEERPRGIFVAWDTLGVKTYRDELWPTYQGGRVFEQSIRDQLEAFPDLCRAFRFGVGKQAGYEADDLGAAAVHAELARGGTCLLYTSDKDNYQLVNELVTVISPKRGQRELERITPHDVVARFGVLPEQVPEFKALAGDASDKIPGIRGIGPKAAAALLLSKGCLEDVVEGWAEADRERALLFKKVCTMQIDAQVELPEGAPDWAAGADVLRKIGANTLADRLAKLEEEE